ncbi:MAG: TAXI family TRAP transporter solute-binding subunit [Spirochaetales bacterium]|nr:TAXI family TRAP transporter solute-binding subunit [Spirochaetales bacterium]
MLKKAFIIALVLVLGFGLVGCKKEAPEESAAAEPQRRFATIGTGGLTGVYYPTGGAISRIVNKKYDEYGLKVTVESTGGSVFNINAVLSGDLEFGIAQSDRQYQAYEGLAEWESTGPQEKLRAVCALHPESITLIAADDAGIKTIEDLKGKRVNIGDPGSGNRGNAIDALQNAGLDWEKDIMAEQIKAVESAKLLQDGRIDAYFYTIGHPNGSITEATAGTRKVHFVPITNVDDLIAKYPFYAKSFIPIALYPNATNKEDAPTYGVKATLVTSSDIPEDIVYIITKEIFENLEEFKALHPAFSVLTKENMLEGNPAPYHDGAIRYFKEAGMMD